jgi:hypothetical protein
MVSAGSHFQCILPEVSSLGVQMFLKVHILTKDTLNWGYTVV